MIPQPCIDRLAEVGRWLEGNGEAVYGTMPHPIEERNPSVDFRVFAKGDVVYVVCLEKPAGDWTVGKLPGVKTVELLGAKTPPAWNSKDGFLRVSPPAQDQHSHAYVYRITCGD